MTIKTFSEAAKARELQRGAQSAVLMMHDFLREFRMRALRAAEALEPDGPPIDKPIGPGDGPWGAYHAAVAAEEQAERIVRLMEKAGPLVEAIPGLYFAPKR